MNKKKIIGLVMVIVGAAYMAGLFTFTEQFEIINDNLAYVLTMISSVMIFLGIGMLMLKTPAERQIEQEALAEESVKVNQYYIHKAYVTPILIGINVLVFGAVNLLQGDEAVLKFAISKYDYAFYKLFTSMFTHADKSHLLFNMLALYICGSKLESLIGNAKFLVVYMASGLGASVMIALFSSSPCVGASGAIFGLFGCYLFIAFNNRKVMKFTYQYDLLPTVVLNLLITFAVPNISVIAHIGGLVIGLICGVGLFRKLKMG